MSRIKSAFALLAVFFSSLNAATVSIVNQTPAGATVPAVTATTPTTVPQTTNQYNQTTKAQTGPALGKLPSSSTSTTSGHAARRPKLEAQEPARFVEQPVYTYPGLLAKIGRRWVGNDYLYNLHRNIGIKIEVVEQEDKKISIDGEGLTQLVAEIFQKGDIIPESLASADTPPLPFFHILIF